MTEGPTANEARLAVREGPLVGAVLSRVVGMIAARALCPMDKLDDALLVADAIAAHGPGNTVDGELVVELKADAKALRFTVSPLRPDGAAKMLTDADLPGVGNVLEQVADEVATGLAADGSETLEIRLAFASAGSPA